MLVIAIIVSFIAGGMVGLIGLWAFALHFTGVTNEEIVEVGELVYKAATNRTSTITLCTENGDSDVMIFEK